MKSVLIFCQKIIQNLLLQTPCFPAKPFDPVTVCRPGKWSWRNGKSNLCRIAQFIKIYLPVIYLIGKNRKRFSFSKKRLNKFPAFQAFCLCERMEFRGDNTGFKIGNTVAWNYLFQFSLIRNRQLQATFGSAAGQHFTAIGSLHSLSETMHRFPAAVMWLKCTFHWKRISFFT